MKTINGAVEIVEELRDEDAVICIHRLFSGMYLIADIGQRIPRHSSPVHEHPDCFIEVVAKGIDRYDAVVCIAEVDVRSRKPGAPTWATERIAWPGVWFRRDAQVVVDFPDRFKPLGDAS